MELNGQTLVVIGGSSGIGLACARQAAEAGATIVIGSRSEARLQAASATLPAGTTAAVVDVSSEESLARLFQRVGAFDHLVITASGSARGRIDEVEPARARRFFDDKFWGSYLAVRLALPSITRTGSIVLTSGAASRRASPGFAFGSALNAAIEALAASLAVELAPIRVNTICPGVIDTPVWNDMGPAQKQDFFGKLGRKLPAARAGTADEVAGAVMFLLTNRYVTGETLVVDGGYRHG